MQRINSIVPVVLLKNEEFWLPYTLKAVRGWFTRFVIYDVGSEDKTRQIIDEFINSEKGEVDFIYRPLPHCPPEVQGTFRNAMIADTESEFYLILDGDEVWPREALECLSWEMKNMQREYEEKGKIYGVVRRLEISHDLKSIHGRDEFVKHHRIYHRTATWDGSHPGEVARHTQKDRTEYYLNPKTFCYHFHQPERSSLDDGVPRRLSRRYQKTYLRGETSSFNILEEIPIMKKPIGRFPVNPILKELQNALK